MRKAVVGCAFTGLLAVGAASAQTYPSRHVTLVVPLATGGSTDTIARIIAEGMRPHLGRNVIVENTPGAVGATGVIRVARAAPDGHTLQIAAHHKADVEKWLPVIKAAGIKAEQ